MFLSTRGQAQLPFMALAWHRLKRADRIARHPRASGAQNARCFQLISDAKGSETCIPSPFGGSKRSRCAAVGSMNSDGSSDGSSQTLGAPEPHVHTSKIDFGNEAATTCLGHFFRRVKPGIYMV